MMVDLHGGNSLDKIGTMPEDVDFVAEFQAVCEAYDANIEMVVVVCDPANFNFHSFTPFYIYQKINLPLIITAAQIRLKY